VTLNIKTSSSVMYELGFRVRVGVEKSGQNPSLDAPPIDEGSAARRHLRTGANMMLVLGFCVLGLYCMILCEIELSM